MTNFRFACSAMGGLLLLACGAAPDTTTTQLPPGTDPGSPPGVASYQAGLQTSGGISFVPVNDPKRRLEFSAPITPRTNVLYQAEGASYPATPAGEAALAHSAALTFKFLLSQCAADYPYLQVPTTDDEVLSAMQRGRNYNYIAKCAYEKFTAKPYWIPQLVADVDICATELGTDWRLPGEADIVALSDADVDFLNRTLTETTTGAGMVAGADSWGKYYFSLTIFIRGTDGVLKLGDLASGVKDRVSALGVSPGLYKNHFEHSGSPLALRCVRWTAVP